MTHPLLFLQRDFFEKLWFGVNIAECINSGKVFARGLEMQCGGDSGVLLGGKRAF